MARAPDILAGRYELLDVLGRGGMGVVHRARDRQLDRTVAVKVLPADLAENPVLVERFEREAKAAARLNHPNIVAVYDTGTDGSVRYIVMECVPGVSLAQLMRDQGELPVAHAVEIGAQVAEALAVAHAASIVHRDIKPGNVMVQPSGVAKVLDFGIARVSAQAALTQTTMVLGSAPYIAPEAGMGQTADERSDLYSLGCLLYEMLTGRPPFLADLPAAVMSQHASAAPRPPRELRPEIPAALEALVLRMLAKQPHERPASAAEVVTALRGVLTQTEEAPTRVAAPPRVSTAPATVATAPVAARPSRPRTPPPPMPSTDRGSSRRLWTALGVLVLALIVGLAVALAASSGPSVSSSTTSTTSSSTPSPSSNTSSVSTTSSSSPSPTSSSTPTSTSSSSQTRTSSSPSSSSTHSSGSTAGGP